MITSETLLSSTPERFSGRFEELWTLLVLISMASETIGIPVAMFLADLNSLNKLQAILLMKIEKKLKLGSWINHLLRVGQERESAVYPNLCVFERQVALCETTVH